MPLDLSTPRNDKSFDAISAAILDRDQPRVADLFFKMVTEEGRSLGEAVSVIMAAEAPYIQVPSHINVRDGQLFLINNDHTILGLRSAAELAPYLEEKYRLLPLLQAVWYVPAGLDIWNQLLGKYPGRYATMKGMNVPPPDHPPAIWQKDVAPRREGKTLEERLSAHMVATVSGEVERSYALFLDLAADPEAREALRDQLMFLGLIDIQDTVIGRKARNTGHKALRARAVTGLADFVSWERAHGVFYAGVPDMAVGPLYYSLYDAVCVRLAADFPDTGKTLPQTNKTPLTEQEVESLVDLLMTGDQDAVFSRITAHLKNGRAIRSIGDAIQIGAAECMLRNAVPRAFTDGIHPCDYCGTANHWLRTTQSPYQARVLYLMANFVNDSARSNNWSSTVIEKELGSHHFAGRDPAKLLTELDEAILAFDVPRSTALAHAYLQSGADRQAYRWAVGVTGCKFQDDPHHQKTLHTAFQEYENNSTHLRDRILLAPVRPLAGWPKMPGERDCYARFMSDWIRH
jgi:hypothetical protein